MSTRVLIVDDDSFFANALSDLLRSHNLDVVRESSGTIGAERAFAERPGVVVLAVELSDTNGFRVCNKLKRTPETANIPVIIVSRDSTEEIFEQHRRLRTRAEHYFRKPVDSVELLNALSQYVPIENPHRSQAMPLVSSSSGDIQSSELVEDFEDDSLDAALDSLTDDAFSEVGAEEIDIDAETGELVAHPATIPPEPGEISFEVAASVAPPPRAPSTPPAPMQSTSIAATPIAASPSGSFSLPPRRISAPPSSELSAVEGQSFGEAALRGRIEQLEADLEEARKKSKASGTSSREFLDLREQLNKKDRELLDVKDQLASRDKQLIESREKNLALERANADAQSRHLELEREIADLRDRIEALQSDKETASKRAEDLRTRLERSDAKLKKREEEFAEHAEQTRAAAEAEVNRVSGLLQAAENLASARLQELNNALQAHEQALVDRDADALKRQNTLMDAHAQQLKAREDEGEQKLQNALSEERATSQSNLERVQFELQSEHQRLQNELQAALQSAQSDVQSWTQKHLEREVEIERLNRQLAESEANASSQTAKLSEVSEMLLSFQKRTEERNALLARAQRAVEIAHELLAETNNSAS